jgi:xylose isomerase
MDIFARALVTADRILAESPYQQKRLDRYSSFEAGKGADFENGKLSLEDLRDLAVQHGEPQYKSGKQEYFENLINRYI